MGEILGFVVGGWLWVGLGRLVARKGAAGDRVLLAGVVAVLAMGALAWFSASTGAAGDRLPEMVAGHTLSIFFWLWRFWARLGREAS